VAMLGTVAEFAHIRPTQVVPSLASTLDEQTALMLDLKIIEAYRELQAVAMGGDGDPNPPRTLPGESVQSSVERRLRKWSSRSKT